MKLTCPFLEKGKKVVGTVFSWVCILFFLKPSKQNLTHTHAQKKCTWCFIIYIFPLFSKWCLTNAQAKNPDKIGWSLQLFPPIVLYIYLWLFISSSYVSLFILYAKSHLYIRNESFIILMPRKHSIAECFVYSPQSLEKLFGFFDVFQY